MALFEWAEEDRATRRLVAAQLVNAKLVTRVDVARVFGLHVNTVSRIAQQVAAEGVTASVRHKRGPRGPFKVTPAVVAELRRAVDDGLTERAAQRQLEQRLKVKADLPGFKGQLDAAGVRNNGIQHDDQSGADRTTFYDSDEIAWEFYASPR